MYESVPLRLPCELKTGDTLNVEFLDEESGAAVQRHWVNQRERTRLIATGDGALGITQALDEYLKPFSRVLSQKTTDHDGVQIVDTYWDCGRTSDLPRLVWIERHRSIAQRLCNHYLRKDEEYPLFHLLLAQVIEGADGDLLSVSKVRRKPGRSSGELERAWKCVEEFIIYCQRGDYADLQTKYVLV